ncbi:hypothetical protein A6769_02850 [Nostoc punctiforme NIES-2108]|uniref:Uncharacterized protein n=1 Tax=Nostoc punctiforme NIES-2108 TaxID=1356359 RepID=A0A367RWU0_NOSPU|nr:hypothetical protein A6769_02850 [Nostoc punctiforme NIES-2108]
MTKFTKYQLYFLLIQVLFCFFILAIYRKIKYSLEFRLVSGAKLLISNSSNEKTPEVFVANLESGKIRIYLYQIFTLRKSYVIRVYTQMQIKVFEDSHLHTFSVRSNAKQPQIS